MGKLSEAVTKKAMIRQMMNAMKEMMADKTLPKSTMEHLEALDADLKKIAFMMAGDEVSGH